MIDLHSHILPNADDGSKSMEETIQMIREAEKSGFTSIISTSHYMENGYIYNTEKREKSIKNIKKELEKNKINMEIYNGAEAYITNDLHEKISNKTVPTLNKSRYLLFELPMNNKVLFLEDVIYNLLSNGIIPIIAHPERYSYVQENPNMLISLIEEGVMFQANYGSIVGKYGSKAKKTVKKLLKSNMIHFLGSDCHREKSVYTNINKMNKKIVKIIGEDRFMEISEINPKKVIDNKEIKIPKPIKINNFFN